MRNVKYQDMRFQRFLVKIIEKAISQVVERGYLVADVSPRLGCQLKPLKTSNN